MHRPSWKNLLLTAGLAAQFACGGPSPAATEPLEQKAGIDLTAGGVHKVAIPSLTRQTNITALVSSGPSAFAVAPILQNYNIYSIGGSGSVTQTSDGGYAFTGTTTAFGDEDVVLVKTDSSLNIQWAYAYGTTGLENGVEVRVTSDGGFVIAGKSFINTNFDFLIVKTDSAGNLQWASPYGGAAQEYAEAMEVTPDGGFIIVGKSQNNVGYQDAFMMKLSSTGSMQWTKSFSSSAAGTYEFMGVTNTPDGAYVAVGSKQVAVSGGGWSGWETYGFAAKVSSTGSTLYQATSGRFARFSGVAATSTGHVAVGYIDTPGSPSIGAEFYAARFNPSSGATVWTRTDSGGTSGDYWTAVKVASDGNYVITGLIAPSQSQRSLLLMKIDNSGTLLWSSSPYPSTVATDGQSLAMSSDGGFIVIGNYVSDNVGYPMLSKFSP